MAVHVSDSDSSQTDAEQHMLALIQTALATALQPLTEKLTALEARLNTPDKNTGIPRTVGGTPPSGSARDQAAEYKVRMLENMNQSLKTANQTLSEEKAALVQQNQKLTQALEQLNARAPQSPDLNAQLKEQQAYYQAELHKRDQQIQKLKQQLQAQPKTAPPDTRVNSPTLPEARAQIPPEWRRIQQNYLRETDDALSPAYKISVSNSSQIELRQNAQAQIIFEENNSSQYHYMLFQIGRSAQYMALPKKSKFNQQKIGMTGLSGVYHFTGEGHIHSIEVPALVEKRGAQFSVVQKGRLTLG